MHAHYVKCPRCHSVDLSVLRRRDGIDKMQRGIFNLLHRIGGGKLYHCWFCRLQFYDLRQRFEAKSERTLLGGPTKTDDVDLKAAS
jgi:hypothetical protein